MSAPIAAWSEFEAWWKERLALRSFPIPDDALPFAKGYALAAWEAAHKAGYREAVRNHDANLEAGAVEHPRTDP